MSKIDLYTNPMSRGQIMRWALHEVGAEYEQHILEYGTTMKSPEYLAVNPMGKVPAIVHNGHVVTECAAICAYLTDAFPHSGLQPAEAERASYYRWMFFGAGPVEAAVTNHASGFDPAPDKEMMFGYGSYDRVIDTLEKHFSDNAYVCGDRFTGADLYVGSQVIWGVMFGTMPPRSSLVQYSDRLTARAAYIAAKAIDSALIAEAQPASAG
ncbi:MAG: glutathione S-transferase [Sphingomonadaceae bacterium PASS1]|nr:MAG: glutathione S-transferase [Sphingomonadaceae bacterium PASS1]